MSLLVVLVSAVAWADPVTGLEFGPVDVPPVVLFAHPLVQADLELDARQRNTAGEVVAAFRKHCVELQGVACLLSKEQMFEWSDGVFADSERMLRQVLTAEQQARLGQIHLQQRRPYLTMRDPQFGLLLSEEQESRLAELNTATGRTAERVVSRLGWKAKRALFRLYAKERADALALLTDDQKKKWRAALGRPIALEALAGLPQFPE